MKQIRITGYEDWSPSKIDEVLMGDECPPTPGTEALQSAVVVLCKRVAELEERLRAIERAAEHEEEEEAPMHICDICAALNDPSSSVWLHSALSSALERDPVDAANEAEALARLLRERAEEVVEEERGHAH
jgi:hypothetical protein